MDPASVAAAFAFGIGTWVVIGVVVYVVFF